mmetsp:Transcript_66984/g.145587  ORF Transcript_66984/g.145587 Transcript_66984/m.145587 type:complete len:270 (+) Transcript_66984:430-1239(+)
MLAVGVVASVAAVVAGGVHHLAAIALSSLILALSFAFAFAVAVVIAIGVSVVSAIAFAVASVASTIAFTFATSFAFSFALALSLLTASVLFLGATVGLARLHSLLSLALSAALHTSGGGWRSWRAVNLNGYYYGGCCWWCWGFCCQSRLHWWHWWGWRWWHWWLGRGWCHGHHLCCYCWDHRRHGGWSWQSWGQLDRDGSPIGARWQQLPVHLEFHDLFIPAQEKERSSCLEEISENRGSRQLHHLPINDHLLEESQHPSCQLHLFSQN